MSQVLLFLSIGTLLLWKDFWVLEALFMRPRCPLAMSELVSRDKNTCKLMKIIALEVPDMVTDIRGAIFVEAESLLHGKVPPETKGLVLNASRDVMDLGVPGPITTQSGVGFLKAREGVGSHSLYQLALCSMYLPLSKLLTSCG